MDASMDQNPLPREPRRRSWLILLPSMLLALLAIGWSAFWFFAAQKADQVITTSLAREAKEGRIYRCGSLSHGGYPFRFEVRCDDIDVELRNWQPPFWLKLQSALVVSQIYQPTLLISEFSGPLQLGALNEAARYDVGWTRARASVASMNGDPRAPERVSIVLDNFTIDDIAGAAKQRMAGGDHAELHARISAGTIMDRPVLDIAGEFKTAIAPALHALAAQPADGRFDATLRGLKDFAPKSWAARFREIQEAGGKIEIRALRLAQAEWLAIGSGVLGLTPAGFLDGEIRLTVAGLDKLLQALGVDYLSRPGGGDRVNSALNALDKLLPGLGAIAREKAGVGLAAGAALLGEQTELEGRKAVTLPLRFDNGAAYLGPIPVAQTKPLF